MYEAYPGRQRLSFPIFVLLRVESVFVFSCTKDTDRPGVKVRIAVPKTLSAFYVIIAVSKVMYSNSGKLAMDAVLSGKAGD